MSDKRILDAEHVARAIFLPAMLDSNGNVSLAAFTLRHNEDYFSAGVSAAGLLLMIQSKLSQLASKSFVSGSTEVNIGE